MSCLHIINKPLNSDKLEQLQQVAANDDAVLFIEDGTYNLVQKNLELELPQLYLLPDALTRGVNLDRHSEFCIAHYEAMVQLVLKYDKSLTWSFT